MKKIDTKEQYKCIVVDLGYYNSEKTILIDVNEDADEIEISTEVDGISIFISDEYYLVAYQKFRDELLKLGYGLKCNGSRINAIQSGMMGHCDKIYLVQMGQQALSNQIVCIWDYADIDSFPDTKIQLEYADRWRTDMESRKLLEALSVAERLKDATRHCYTKNGRHESVAEHSWMMTLMAFFMKDEFPEADMDKVIKMCIIHDLGEAFTGDIPTFEKTAANEQTEEELLYSWVNTLPENYAAEMIALYDEMAKRETLEAKVYKAIDSLEALIQHNISDLSTWIPKEYELNKTYADDKVAFSEYLKELREEVRKDTLEKIGGTMPEDLPTPEKSIQQIEKEQMARLKAKAKNGKLMLDE